MVWLGVFSHPDDETSASAGTMVKWIKKGNEAHVVTATGGEKGTLGTGGQKILRENLAAVRESELRKNLDMYGAHPPYMLGYVDQELSQEKPTILSKKVLDIIETLRPDVIITFGPNGISNHPDHIAIHVATLIAYEEYKENISNTTVPLLIYPSIPPESAERYELDLSDDEKRMDIVVDIENSINKKIQGLLNYKSQEDAQEFAKHLNETDTSEYKESFSVSPSSVNDKRSIKLMSYLKAL